jgi:hypothetical protein
VSKLVDFYRGEATDSEGRSLGELWGWNDDELEAVHDFIQWMFPLPEPSRFNPDAPLLTSDDAATFRGDALLQARLRKSFERILMFLGLSRAADGSVAEGANFTDRVPEVWQYPNHNWLRITRIIRCLCLLGLKQEAEALFTRLEDIYSARKCPITGDTFRYWTDALHCAD